MSINSTTRPHTPQLQEPNLPSQEDNYMEDANRDGTTDDTEPSDVGRELGYHDGSLGTSTATSDRREAVQLVQIFLDSPWIVDDSTWFRLLSHLARRDLLPEARDTILACLYPHPFGDLSPVWGPQDSPPLDSSDNELDTIGGAQQSDIPTSPQVSPVSLGMEDVDVDDIIYTEEYPFLLLLQDHGYGDPTQFFETDADTAM